MDFIVLKYKNKNYPIGELPESYHQILKTIKEMINGNFKIKTFSKYFYIFFYEIIQIKLYYNLYKNL